MGQDTHVIRARTEHAREELASDITALSEKLNVKKQVDRKKTEVVDTIKGKLGMNSNHGVDATFASSNQSETGAVLKSMKEHPLAVLALGYGAKTLFSSWQHKHQLHAHRSTNVGFAAQDGSEGGIGGKLAGVKDAVVDTASSVKDKAVDVKDTVAIKALDAKDVVTDKASSAKSTVSGSASSAKDGVGGTASTVGTAISDQAGSVGAAVTRVMPNDRAELEQTVRTNLPAFAIGAVAVGAIVGLMSPRTRFEDEKLGDLHEQIVDTAQSKVLEAKDAVQHGLQEGLEPAKEGLKDALDTAKQSAKEGIKSAKETAKEDLKPSSSSEDTPADSGDALIRPMRPGMITGSRTADTVGTTGGTLAP